MKKRIPKSLKISIIVTSIVTFIVTAILIVWCFFKDILFYAIWFIAITFFTLMCCLSGLLTPPPLPPEIKYAEFPVELVYEIEGERYEISDILICEYEGWTTTSGGIGKERCWSDRFESGKDKIIIFDDGETMVEWMFFTASTYMGDKDCWNFASYAFRDEDYWISEPRFYIITEEDSYEQVSMDELSSELGITVVEYELPDFITNNFSLFNLW